MFGARLRITGLRAASGPGIEFLEYLTPRTGRPYPVDALANDLLHGQTTLTVNNAESLSQKLRSGRVNFVSSNVVNVPENTLAFKKGFLVRDPDGHAMLLVEK